LVHLTSELGSLNHLLVASLLFHIYYYCCIHSVRVL